jgi:hypothetical protein
LTQFREKLNLLRPHANVPIDKLDPAIKDQFQEVHHIAELNWATSPSSEIARVIGEVFGDLNQVEKNTIAAYFRGCYVKNDTPGLPSCSPVCVTGFKPVGNGFVSCPDRVVMYNGSRIFDVLNPEVKNPLRTNIYMKVPSFVGFSETEVKILKEMGVTDLQIYNKNSDGEPYINIFDGDIGSLKVIPDAFANDMSSSSSSDSDSNAWWIVVVVVAVFLIVLFLIVLLGWNNLSKSG